MICLEFAILTGGASECAERQTLPDQINFAANLQNNFLRHLFLIISIYATACIEASIQFVPPIGDHARPIDFAFFIIFSAALSN